MEENLSPEQLKAFDLMQSGENVFLTGGAGSGKSHLIRAFKKNNSIEEMPILASTGAAAVLLGGRTFHSFFSLGILEGGPEAAYEKAIKDKRVLKRIKNIEGFVLDEISMISGATFDVAERIAKYARQSSLPWGGLRVIVVGDFAQLPPVTRGAQRDWAFSSRAWADSDFQNCVLTHNHRVEDQSFLDILADVRTGNISERVVGFLDSRLSEHNPEDDSARLFPRRDQAEIYNRQELAKIERPQVDIDSIFLGDQRFIEILQKSSPVAPTLSLKVGCRVMFIQNDPQKKWVNGTRGTVMKIEKDKIIVEKSNRRDVEVEKVMFSLLDADGNAKASVFNYPLCLAYATTIHKSQGATMEKLWVDLSRLWEPGHAYVALSRLKSGEGLSLLSWQKRSFLVDPKVVQFYESLI